MPHVVKLPSNVYMFKQSINCSKLRELITKSTTIKEYQDEPANIYTVNNDD